MVDACMTTSAPSVPPELWAAVEEAEKLAAAETDFDDLQAFMKQEQEQGQPEQEQVGAPPG